MLKKACLTIAALLPLMAVQAKADAPTAYNCDYQPSCEVSPGKYGAMTSPTKSKFNLSVGGFVKLDYVHNSVALGPLYPAGPIPPTGTAASKRNETIMTARQSRIWFKVDGPTFLGAKTGGLIEADFFGTGSLSNEFGNFRMRHAYATMDWANTQLLFGQFWDVFGPVGGNTIDLRQSGHTGAAAAPRVPQIRFTQRFNLDPDNQIKLIIAAENPLQDNPTQSTPGNATSYAPSLGNNGAYGAVPNAAAQLVFSSKALGVAPGFWGMSMNPLQVGLFGLYGTQKIVGNDQAVPVDGYGAFTFIPILKSKDGISRKMTANLEATAYISEGLAVQGGNVLGLVGDVGHQRAARGFGYLVQGSFYPTHDLGIAAGYGHRAILHNSDYPAGTERNQQLFFANVSYDLNAAFRIAVEFEHGESRFKGNAAVTAPGYAYLAGATSDYGQVNTGRMSVMYFF
jgi:hypothetical protein